MLTARIDGRTVEANGMSDEEWELVKRRSSEPLSCPAASPLSLAPMDCMEFDGMRFFRPKPGFTDGLPVVETLSLLRLKIRLVKYARALGCRTTVEHRPEGCPAMADLVIHRENKRPLAVMIRPDDENEGDLCEEGADELEDRGFDVLMLLPYGSRPEVDWPVHAGHADGWRGVAQRPRHLRFYMDFSCCRVRFDGEWHTIEEFMRTLLGEGFRVRYVRKLDEISIRLNRCRGCHNPIFVWMCEWDPGAMYDSEGVRIPSTLPYPQGTRREEEYSGLVSEWAASHRVPAYQCMIEDRGFIGDFTYRAFVCPMCRMTLDEFWLRGWPCDFLIPVAASDSAAVRTAFSVSHEPVCDMLLVSTQDGRTQCNSSPTSSSRSCTRTSSKRTTTASDKSVTSA